MTFPGRLYFDDPSRDWPGDTIKPDGTVRTPMWLRGEYITPDQYDVVTDTSKRMRYGTRTVARAKPGTNFYYRMAAWPGAFEEGMREAMRRHLPDGEYSIYGTGHSTGGPHIFMMCQRVPNMAGVIAVEHSPFGAIQAKQHDWSGALGKIAGFERVSKKPDPRSDPFNELYIRTWRDLARYRGPEALGQEGPAALMRLPWLMEEILDAWETAKKRPQFKAEYIITHNVQASLKAGAEATADRLKMSAQERAALVERFCSYPYPVAGKPVPPILFHDHQGQPRPQRRRLPGSGAAGVRQIVAGAENGADSSWRRRSHLLEARRGLARRRCSRGRLPQSSGNHVGIFYAVNWSSLLQLYINWPCARSSLQSTGAFKMTRPGRRKHQAYQLC